MIAVAVVLNEVMLVNTGFQGVGCRKARIRRSICCYRSALVQKQYITIKALSVHASRLIHATLNIA